MFPELPTYQVTPKNFVVDDRSVDYPALRAVQEAENPEADGPGIFGAESFDYSSTTNLWLEIPTNGVASNLVQLLVHNTSEGLPYTLLTKTDLNLPAWTPELIITGAVGTVTHTQLPQNNRTNLFIWAHSGLPDSFIEILFQPLDQEVLEGDMVTFSVTAAALGSGPLTYQWTRNGVPISGATNRSYTMEVVWETDEAGYAVTVSNGAFSLGSRTAELLVYPGTEQVFYTVVFGPRQDYQFKRGHTYYVGMAVDCYGETILEGGAVLKFDAHGSDATVRVHGDLMCRTEPYFPAILTSVDDDSAGVVDWLSNHEPEAFTNGYPYLDLTAASSGVVSNLHFRFADHALTVPAAAQQLDVWHSQFYQCHAAIENQAGNGARIGFHNVLLAGCGAAVIALTNSYVIEAEHLTANVGDFWVAATAPSRISLTNSIVQGVFTGGGLVQTPGTLLNATGAVFQPTTYAHYYLATNSPAKGAGITNISPALLGALRQRTTQPPLEIPGNTVLSGETTLFPLVPRYTNGTPDAGYYYDALDYVLGEVRLRNGKLTIQPGTALAAANLITANSNWTFTGILAENGAEVTSRGTPTAPNIFTTTKLVQEIPPTQFSLMGFPFGIVWLVAFHNPFVEDAVPPRFDFAFSKSYLPYEDYHLWAGHQSGMPVISYESLLDWSLTDSELHGGQVYLGRAHPLFFNGQDYLGAGTITWRNSLFDMVNLWIDPSYHRYFGVVDCDLALTAEHNLFRNGAWLYLLPLPATAGDWTFKDNLFDKVHFLRTTNAPIVMDYNAYWPVPPADTLWAQEEILPLPRGSGNDVTLSSAPPYQTGPLGKYYLPQLTPLYHAGSLPAGAAGLYHYTMRTNQITAGQDYELFGGNGNIGRHYVAVSNQPAAVSPHLQDTDGDGVADYVEDKNGNGTVEGNETSPLLAQTVSGIHDATNAVYDDVDLDGDGLTGFGERNLSCASLAQDNPLKIAEIISAEPYVRSFLITASAPVLTNDISEISLYIDGRVSGLSEVAPYGSNTYRIDWNTLGTMPGAHHFQVNFPAPPSASPSEKTTPSRVFGPSLFVVNDAPLWFDYTSQLFGSQLRVAGGMAANLEYQIQIRTTNGTLVKTFSGTAGATGAYEKIWDLIPDNATEALSDDVFKVTIILDPNASTNGGITVLGFTGYPLPVPLPNFIRGKSVNSTGAGTFTLAFGWHNHDGHNKRKTMVQRGVTDIIFNPALDNEYNHTPLNSFHGNTFFLHYQLQDPELNDTEKMLADMLQADNFFYFGHGNGKIFGSQVGETEQNLARISSFQLAERLNNRFRGIKGWTARDHPYRLVILNACRSFDDNMSLAFGIQNQENAELAFFQKDGQKPQAFVGWKVDFNVPVTGIVECFNEYEASLTTLSSAWMTDVPLKTCLKLAAEVNNGSITCPNINKKYGIFGWPNLTRSGGNE